jgi:ribosomal-protein-alanine N-acetyltransferase
MDGLGKPRSVWSRLLVGELSAGSRVRFEGGSREAVTAQKQPAASCFSPSRFFSPPFMILKTARLILRPMTLADATALFAILGDDEAMRFWDRPAIRRLAVVEEIVREQLEAVAEGTCLYWTVWDKNQAVGSIDMSFIADGEAQFGFLFRRDCWGQGYAAEAAAAVIAHAFDDLELTRLKARIHAGNRAAARVLAKTGFMLEEMRPGYRLDSGRIVTCEFYVRLRPRDMSNNRNGT